MHARARSVPATNIQAFSSRSSKKLIFSILIRRFRFSAYIAIDVINVISFCLPHETDKATVQHGVHGRFAPGFDLVACDHKMRKVHLNVRCFPPYPLHCMWPFLLCRGHTTSQTQREIVGVGAAAMEQTLCACAEEN